VPLPTYEDGVNATLTVCKSFGLAAATTGEAVPVGDVGVVGFFPPLSFGALLAINYAEMSPTRTQVLVARLMSVAYDHCVRSFKPGAAFTVTPDP
jgi:hypothetical protein